MSGLAGVVSDFDWHALSQQPVYPPVLSHHVGALRATHSRNDKINGFTRELRVEP